MRVMDPRTGISKRFCAQFQEPSAPKSHYYPKINNPVQKKSINLIPPNISTISGGDVDGLDIDGVSQWGRLTDKKRVAPRSEFIVNAEFLVDINTDSVNETVCSRSYIDGPWKLVWGILYPQSSNFLGAPGNTVGSKPYDFDGVLRSETMDILLSASALRNSGVEARARRLRRLATLPNDCRKGASKQVIPRGNNS